MTREIPAHLRHLRTDRRGLPVPYINRWGPERVESLSIEPDENAAGMPAVFQDDTDQTEPDFTNQNLQRQRECMYLGLCQVCANHVPWSRRFLVVAALSVQKIQQQDREVTVFIEPWLCERCATFAIDTCPALIRRRRDEKLQLLRVRRRQVQLVVSRGWIEGPFEEESRRLMPAMWVKALVAGVELRSTEHG